MGRDLTPKTTERNVSLMVAEGCNLECGYCFQHLKRPRVMEFAIAREAIDEFLGGDDPFESVLIDFMGGEPMLAFRLIKEVVEYVEARSWPRGYRFSMSTNGTLFNDRNMPWLIERKDVFTPMLSLDGTKAAHDMNRSGSYDRIVRNIDFFRHWPHQSFRMTVDPRSLPFLADGVLSILALGFPAEAYLVFEDVWGRGAERRRNLRMMEYELARLVDFFSEYPDQELPDLVDLPLQNCLAEEPPGPWCGAGCEMVAVGIDGERYPCHRFLEFCSGRALSLEQYRRIPVSGPGAPCDACPVVAACPTCQAFNWESTGDLWRRQPGKCEFTKLQMVATAAVHENRITRLLERTAVGDLEDEVLAELKRKLDAAAFVFEALSDVPRAELRPYVAGDRPSGARPRVRWHDQASWSRVTPGGPTLVDAAPAGPASGSRRR